MPHTIKKDICLVLAERIKINPMESMEPKKAARINVTEFNNSPCCKKKIIVNATTNFAPEEIPSTKGPAMGFEKKFCNKQPDTDNAPPKIAAASSLGRRI